MQTQLEAPLGIHLKPSAKLPLRRQLFDALVARIHDGTFPQGFRLPPTRQLAEEVGTHRNTVVTVYEDLVQAGFVESTVGRGTFVAIGAAERVPVTSPSPRAPMPWSSLMTRAVSNDAFSRAERFSHGVAMTDAIQLNRMQPMDSLLPHDLFRRCVDRTLLKLGAKALGYAPAAGLLRLRELIAHDLGRQGVPAVAEDLIITTGSQQALDLLARTLITPGDRFLVDESTYAGAVRLLAAAGARLIPVPCDDEGPDLSVLERMGPGAKGFYLMPNCLNPTGRRISATRREGLVEWSHRHGVPLIEDDYASDLNLDGKKPPAALRTLDGEVLYLGTYSKKLIPALRIGYLLAPKTLRGRLEILKHALDLGNSALLQHALAEFLDRGYLEAHLKKTLPAYRARRDALDLALKKALPSHITWTRPETGLAMWIPLPLGPDPESIWLEGQKQGVVVGPGSLNGITEAGQKGLRLTFCAEPVGRLAEGAKRLGKAFTVTQQQQSKTVPSRLEAV